jgi:hypothetical protein
LSAPAFVGVGVYIVWEFTDGWKNWLSFDALLSIICLIMTVVMGVGMVIAAMEFTKDKH